MQTTAPTLDTIRAEQTRLAAMIAAFESQQRPHTLELPAASISLQAGEHYAGIILGHDGEQSYHLVLLPGEIEDVDWKAAEFWAAEADGELPTRREQALLYANLKSEFAEAWYWSSQQHESDPDYVWCQFFGDGYQLIIRLIKCRARAVRRLTIS